jgi:hypothetical protein
VSDSARRVQAAREALYCERILAKSGGNVALSLIGGATEIVAGQHYPAGDIYDPDSGAQVYYHAHGDVTGEHGHSHCFLRPDGLGGPIHHLIALGIDGRGRLTRLFTVNRWVTGDDWRPAADLIALLPRFDLHLARPDYLANRWLTAVVALYRDEIADLLEARDAALVARDIDVLEDRALDVLSARAVNLDATYALLSDAASDGPSGRDRM